MVLIYVKKTTLLYSTEMLAEALAGIKVDRMTVYGASKSKSESRGRNTLKYIRENENLTPMDF